ncbi:MAG: ankyrin repeat domain-containing protein [Bacteroidota bacterium]
MRRFIFSVSTVLLFVVQPFFAQESSNIFLDRDYWRSNPSIQDIEQKIADGNDVSQLNRFAFDAISYALIEKVDNNTIKHLLSKEGNGVNKLTHDGRTYIFWAAYKDNLDMMQYLVDQGAKTDIIDSHGYSLLNFSAVTGQLNTKLYDFLLDHGADPKTEKNHDGANALLLVAPFLKDFELVEYFISKSVDLTSTDNNGNGIFNYAAKGGNLELLDLLIDKGLPYKAANTKGGNAVLMASQGTRGRQNTIDVYKFLEDKGLNINVVGEEGRNPLHNIAYRTDDLELLTYFLDRGVDVNLKDDEGRTAFMNAAGYNSLDVVTFFAPRVDNLDAKDKNGHSALTLAVNRNKTDVVQFLLEKKADVSTIDKDGNSLMYYVLNTYRSGEPKVFEEKLQLLVDAGLDTNATQGKGNTLYHLAVEKGNLELLKRVHNFKIDVNTKNDDGLSPLHLAAMKAKNEDILKYLLSIGADKSAKTDFEESVYDLAMENELLQKHNININFLK